MDLSNQNVIHVKKNGEEFLQFRKLLEYKEVKHAYSLGLDKNFRTARANNVEIPPEEYKAVLNNYKEISDAIGINYLNLVKPNQNHTDNVQVVKSKIEKDKPDFNLPTYSNTDGLITNKKDIALATTNADCILLLFYDPIKKVIANTHSGWKGTLQRISVKTVEKMQKSFGCNPKDIICCICPSIRKCHFEVERDVETMFEKEFSDLGDLSSIIEETKKGIKWHIDTVEINKIILQRAGLKPENILDSGICSVCNKEIIHSYRAEGKEYKLSTAIISLV